MITASVFATKSDYAVSNIIIWHFKNNEFRQNLHFDEFIWYTEKKMKGYKWKDKNGRF